MLILLSCFQGTQLCAVYQVVHCTSRNVYLVDTPGFDDTEMSDSEVLSILANWLAITYSHQTKLHGILYLHRITDVRFSGTAKRNLKVFRDLCGQNALSKVVLVTTMWENLPLEKEGEERERELATMDSFWGYMIKKGSKLERHTNNMQSAKRLVDMFLPAEESGMPEIASLAIQEEMTLQNRSLADTTAGEIVRDDIAKERARISKAIEDCRNDIEKAQQERDEERRQEAQELLVEMEKSSNMIRARNDTLRRDMEEMIRSTYDQAIFEKEDEMSRRLADQYSIRSGTSPTANGAQSPEFSSLPEVFIPTSSLGTRLTSPVPIHMHSFFQTGTQPLSLSLRGRHCSFIGIAYEKS